MTFNAISAAMTNLPLPKMSGAFVILWNGKCGFEKELSYYVET